METRSSLIDKPKVTIGVPIWKEPIHPIWYKHFLDLEKPNPCEYIFERTIGIHRARRNIVRNASGEYVFFLDSDVLCPIDGLLRLLEDGKDIVSGLYFKSTFPHTPQMYRKVGEDRYSPILDYDEGIVEVDGIGLGCCLIKKSVFESIPEPWFDLPALSDLSEDLYFCERAKRAGYTIYVDTRVKCGHISEVVVDERYFKALRHLIG